MDAGTTTSVATPNAAPLLEFREVTKAFGAVVAVNCVSFDLKQGEIHALAGENGAGKSTLIRILAGAHAPESGEILLDGQSVRFTHPREAIEHGIGCVHQIPTFVPNLSVTENLLLGTPYGLRRAGLIDWRAEHRAARSDLAGVGLTVDPRENLETLRPHERQLVAVARALKRGLRILVLDEVTAALSEPEMLMVHGVVRELRNRGVAVMYVSHRLEETFLLADRVTVLRDGQHVGTLPMKGLGRPDVARLIVGREVDLFKRRESSTVVRDATPRLAVRDLRDDKLRRVSFDLYPGEVLGLAGLAGSGRTRLLHLLFGARARVEGDVSLDGEVHRFRHPSEALAAGVALLTEDRHFDGYVGALPLWQNATLPWLRHFRKRGLLSLRNERMAAAEMTHRLGVRAPSVDAMMTELSGGNQQKVLLGRWLLVSPRLLLLDEPTHGVDIRSKSEIYEIIRSLASEGMSVIIVSSEFEELEALCDRVLLLHDGQIMGDLRGRQLSKENLLHALLAGVDQAA